MVSYATFDDTLLIAVCERFLRGDKTRDIVDWLETEHGICLTRENVYPLVREARKRGYLSILPPPDGYLQQRISDCFAADKERVRVLRVRGETARQYVAEAAAQTIVDLVHRVGEKKSRVRVGMEGGATVMMVASALASRLRLEGSLPKLGLHALSSGFDVNDPRTSPVSFLGYFDDAAPDIEYVGLFAPAVVDVNEYEHVKTLPGVEQSFRKAREIDIVVTSLARADDPDGALNRFMAMSETGGKGIAALKKAGWVGDVGYRPYSKTRPIDIRTGSRAVSLFELEDLVELAQKANKYVVLVAAPCGICQETKGEALRPLLEQPSLQLWTHLLMDLTTAQDVLPKAS